VFYPLFLDLMNRPVLVVGGGVVAERKVDSLLEAGADVRLVSPDLTDHLQELSSKRTIRVQQRKFEGSDLDGVMLVVSATDDRPTQEHVAVAARARGILVNTVDRPALCDFIVPAVIRQGDVMLAISTSGKSPALAAALRAKLEKVATPDIARAARVLGEVRTEVHEQFPDPEKRKEVFERIVETGILDWIAQCDDDTALRRVREIIERSK
jgi:precorrin-2 dehydrogenase/sirohydrochlorin ferrochelatase